MNAPTPFRVLVADDHYVVRQGLRAILEAAGDLAVVAEAKNGHEAVALFGREQPDVAILDVRMPELDGVSAMKEILQKHPEARLLALSNYEGDVDIQRALDAGAASYVLKRSIDESLPGIVRAVARGERRLPREVRARLAESSPRSHLTERETEVLQMVAHGRSNKEIAGELGLSVNTVNNHLSSILVKLGVADRTEAVTSALARGIVRMETPR
jgi:DNA-binding NarL/FixJ family response regulator